MTLSVENVKKMLTSNGLQATDTAADSLDILAQEICESVEGLTDRRDIADTIYGNLTASGVDIERVDDLMGLSEKFAHSISTLSNI